MKFDHEENFFAYGECTKCNCSEYIRRDSPTKADLVWLLMTFVYFGIAISTVFILWIEFDQITEEVKGYVIDPNDDKPTSVGELLEVILFIWICFMILFCWYLSNLSIISYFRIKRRKIRD